MLFLVTDIYEIQTTVCIVRQKKGLIWLNLAIWSIVYFMSQNISPYYGLLKTTCWISVSIGKIGILTQKILVSWSFHAKLSKKLIVNPLFSNFFKIGTKECIMSRSHTPSFFDQILCFSYVFYCRYFTAFVIVQYF